MDYDIADFNGAREYFDRDYEGVRRWSELEEVIATLVPQFQPSDQASKIGQPIFDPKGTNAALTASAADLGWYKVPVPQSLKPFGLDWDGGKGSVLAEWQFSNYPFLWNNIIRSEAVFQSEQILPPLRDKVDALVVVTKSGRLPASNSTLYFEQAVAQIDTVTSLNVFNIPIRLVGLTIPEDATQVDIDWNEYGGRYNRVGHSSRRTMDVTWGRARQYGQRPFSLS